MNEEVKVIEVPGLNQLLNWFEEEYKDQPINRAAHFSGQGLRGQIEVIIRYTQSTIEGEHNVGQKN